jgi:hypothetical protein
MIATLYIELRLRLSFAAVLSLTFCLMKRKIRFCPAKDTTAIIVNKPIGQLEVDFRVSSEIRIVVVSSNSATITIDTTMKICLPLYFCVKVSFELSWVLGVLAAMPHLCEYYLKKGSLT